MHYTRYIFTICICSLFSFLFYACGTIKPYYGKSVKNWETLAPPDTSKLLRTVFLIGDAGTMDNNPVLQLLNQQLKDADALISPNDTLGKTMNTVIFLGDNIYYYGLPEEEAPDRDEKEQIINSQMDALQGFRGHKIFIPGNHDWKASSPGGLETLNRQEQYIEVYADSTIEFLPNLGCPGPYELHLSDDMVILIVDSEWWLTRQEKPLGPENGCFVDDRFDFIVQLQDAVQRNSDKNILIVQHHPLFSNSNHGGRYSLVDNIFPLTLIRDNLYIPLPVIGSLYPLLRKYGVSRQDISNPVYNEFVEEILSVIEDQPNIIFAAGHDHNLQLTDHQEIWHIVSGSGGKSNFAARGAGASYVQQVMGFSRLNYFDNGSVWVEFWTASEDKPEGTLTFTYPLYSLELPTQEKIEELEPISYADSTKTVVAGKEYKAGKLKEFFLGKQYREEWTTPIKVPYLDFATEKGGLTPIQKGGGNQTISLRLLNKDSVQFVLRSVNKNPRGAIPEPLFNTFAEDLVKDQISTAHPYGALAIPKMAASLNLFHTTPSLFYTPHSNILGPYQEEFGGMLGMLEIRPDEDLSEFKKFGYSENVVSTKTMLRHLEEDNDNEVDKKMFLKTRLFDMLINDWDRHEDQYRWSEFKKEGKGSIFKPIARDRDQVFSKYEGLIPYLMSRKWALRNFQNFEKEIKDLIGLNIPARNIDRMLLSSLSKEDWEAEAAYIQTQLTDEVLEEAIQQMPQQIVEISGGEILAKLKARRDDIDKWAMAYYAILSEEVDITGSNKHELYLIERISNAETSVRVFKRKKKGKVKHEIFNRTFYGNETEEIRIYAKGGEDSVQITGNVEKGIKVRIIGGEGNDVIQDLSTGGKVLIYDQSTEDNRIVAGPSSKIKTSENAWVNSYEPNFEYDYAGPRLSVGYNVDDGLLLGAGAYIKKSGFRKNPKVTHLLMASYAFNTSAFGFRYGGNFYSLMGRNWDLALDANFLPGNVINFFGFGNNSAGKIEDINYYRVKLNQVQVKPTIVRRFNESFKVGLGPAFEYYDLAENRETILNEGNYPVDKSFYFMGGSLFANLSLLDYEIDPRRGIKWFNSVNYYKEVGGSGDMSVTNFDTDISLYISPNLPFDITAAIRFGASANLGDFYFFQAQVLGGNTNLRGFRNSRFAGKSTVFNNSELRLRLFDIQNYVFTGSYGLIGFVDSGRVWSDTGDGSEKWHKAYGPGVWINFYKLFLVSGTVAFSDEGTFFNLRLGHFF